MLTDNSGPNGEFDTEAFQRAMLQYRNTPNQDTKLSPAMCLFGRPIKDFIPILPGKYLPHPTWQSVLADRETALRQRHMKIAERLEQHTKRLPPLRVGDRVRVQNQVGSQPKKWDKTGTVIEVKQHDQYIVRVDGSRRVTLRNRKFLRRYIPVHQPIGLRTNQLPISAPPLRQAPYASTEDQPQHPSTFTPTSSTTPREESTSTPEQTPELPPQPSAPATSIPAPTTVQDKSPRRSTRARRRPAHLDDYET